MFSELVQMLRTAAVSKTSRRVCATRVAFKFASGSTLAYAAAGLRHSRAP